MVLIIQYRVIKHSYKIHNIGLTRVKRNHQTTYLKPVLQYTVSAVYVIVARP